MPTDISSVFIVVYGKKQYRTIKKSIRLATSELKLYITGCLILVLSASVHPRYIKYLDRVKSHASTLRNEEVETLSESGFYPGVTNFTCFHCGGTVTNSLSNASSTILWREHLKVASGCFFAKLRMVLVKNNSVLTSVKNDITRYFKALKKLQTDFRSANLKYVESFGFPRTEVVFVVTRFFMKNNGQIQDKPGEIIKSIYEYRELYPVGLLEEFDLEKFINLCFHLSSNQTLPTQFELWTSEFNINLNTVDSADSRSLHSGDSFHDQSILYMETESAATNTANESTNPSFIGATEAMQNTHEEADINNGKCKRCGNNARNRVFLPCGHFILCNNCIESQSLSRCPSCGSGIIGLVVAFVC